MKKKYVIFTYNVCNMGGGQLFVLRRSLYLKKNNYDVSIIVTFDNGIFPLKDAFKDFPIYIIPEMGDTSAHLSNRKINSILNYAIQKIGASDELYFESHTLQTTEWAEMLAYKCKSKHLSYQLTEPIISQYKFQPGLKIFNDKLTNGQFYACSSTAQSIIWERNVEPNNFINVGFDENELKKRCNPILPIKKRKDEYVICTVTRLDKIYVEPLIKDTVKLALNHPYQKFVLLIAGGSNTSNRENFLFSTYNNKTLNISNLNLVYTGYIIELGKDIFDLTDVFVGMGTASINAISQHCLCINVDPLNDMKNASGFFGTDTCNFAYSDSISSVPIIDKLEEAYSMDPKVRFQYISRARNLYEKDFEMYSCFRKIDNVIFNDVKISNIKYSIPIAYKCFIAIAKFSLKKIRKIKAVFNYSYHQ